MMHDVSVVFDNSWIGLHGIGRFAREVLARLNDAVAVDLMGRPLSASNILKLPFKLLEYKDKRSVFFTPGFNPPIYSPIPFIFTIHDLTFIRVSGASTLDKKLYYNLVIKPAARRAFKILTDSNFSKADILRWVGIPEEKVVVVGCGVSDHFSDTGVRCDKDFSYLFCLGNYRMHKNLVRTIQAFASAKLDAVYKLVIAGTPNQELSLLANKLNIQDRVEFSGIIPEDLLPSYYRGAVAFLFPSLYEGFGLPILEAMACGTPVLTSNVTAMPEVAGDAALLVDPYDVGAIASGIERLVHDQELRRVLVSRGLERATMFTWDKTASAVNAVLQEALNTL